MKVCNLIMLFTFVFFLGSANASEIVNVFDEIILVENSTGYGQGAVFCPVDYVALGGGSYCTLGSFDTAWPLVVGGKPVGWMENHRGTSSNDCFVRAICVPESEFSGDDIRVVTNFTGYGQGGVQCGGGYKVISGGAYCSNGYFDVNYPKMDRSGWNEWHRGGSSNDCEVYAVCVRENHRIAQHSTISEFFTGYGQGQAYCANGDYAIGGGSYCTLGDFDVSYPSDDLSSWKEWHRGTSSLDCRAYATCLDYDWSY